MSDTATEAEEPTAPQPEEKKPPTVKLANKNHAQTEGPDGNPLDFEAGVSQEVDAFHAHKLLQIQDAGFYIEGEEQPDENPDPNLPLYEAERIGRVAPSPFETTEQMQKEQDLLDAHMAELEINAIGPAIPPRKGRGSSAASWQDYAEQLGHHPPEGASRDQIIAYLDSQGVDTEQRGGTATILGATEEQDEESESEPSGTTEPTPAAVQTEANPDAANTEVAPGAAG